MKVEDLVEGEFYTTDIKNPGFIFKARGNCKGIAYLWNKTFDKGRPGEPVPDLVSCFGTYRLATPQEKEHLQQCIQAGKFVEYKKQCLIYNYLIL